MSASIFHIEQRNSIWRVSLDGRFFGDFRSQTQARASVDEAAVALRASGRVVQVLPAPN